MNAEREIDTMIQKHRQILQEILTSMGYAIDAGETMEKAKNTEKLKEVDETMKDYLELESKLKGHIQALQDLKSKASQKVLEVIHGETYCSGHWSQYHFQETSTRNRSG